MVVGNLLQRLGGCLQMRSNLMPRRILRSFVDMSGSDFLGNGRITRGTALGKLARKVYAARGNYGVPVI